MEKMEDEFSEAQNGAQEYLDARKDELSSTCSDVSENVRHLQMKENEARRQVEQIQEEVRYKEEEVARMRKEIEADFERRKVAWEDQIRAEKDRLFAANREVQIRHEQLEREMDNELGLPTEDPIRKMENIEGSWAPPKNTSGVISSRYNPYGIERRIEKSDPEFSPQAHGPQKASNQGSIGQDMWKQLKRVSIPIFRGDKRTYENWKAAFLACIDQAPATAEYKLLQLRQYLSGEALKSIENLGHSATAYEAAKSRLERKYGGTCRQIAIYLEELESFKPIRTGYAKDIEKFADLLDIAVVNLKEAGRQDELGNGSLYVKLQKKIPESMLARYHRWVFEKCKDESVEILREWIIQEAEFQTIASETVRGLASTVKEETQKVTKGSPRTFFGNSQTIDNRGSSLATQRRSCKVCNRQHGIWTCDQFKKMNPSQRWEIAKKFKLCYRCLGDGHLGQACTRSRICGLDGCRETHNRLLHKSQNSEGNSELKRKEVETKFAMERNEENLSSRGDRRDKTLTGSPAQLPVSNAMEGEQRQEPIATKSSYATRMSSKVSGNVGCEFIALRTVPVVLKNGNRKMVVKAVLDDASTTTYINSDVAAELGLQGEPQKVTVNVLNGHAETFETMPVEVGLESINGKMDVMIHAFTTEKVTGNMGVIEWEKHAKKWSHLKSIDFPKPGPRPFADVLIGIDHADLHYSYRDIRGKPGEPIARLTPLGWTCVGAPNGKQRSNFHTNFVRTHLVYGSKQNADMDSMLRKFWEIESSGTQAYAQPLKPEEQMALQKVKNSLKFNGKRYELAMPWKQDRPELPNNYSMAVRRLCGTEKRLMKNPEAGSAYSEIINTYVQKGYIRKVLTSEEVPKEKWYLPHFAVFRPDKATTKTRIVFDASAKYEGISLNDTIHQGPKLQRDLFNVLLRFRRYPVALVCDIAEMYLQIEIATEDRSYHRFLWRNLDQKLAPDEYEFNRVVFGVNSSPFQAQLVSQEHAAKHKGEFPMAAETVLESTYMDDSMDSVPNDSSGVELYKQLSGLWGKAGMHARKWLSNSEVVLKKIPSGDRALEVDLDKGNLPSLKTLGVLWLAKEDIFTFKASAPEEHFQFTKRNFLKKIATLFDPMGFLAPFTIRSKILLQDMWACGLGWDELLDLQLTKKARKWFSELADLTEIKVPRCLQVKKEGEVISRSLHTFSDASEEAYGAVSYVRYQYSSGAVSVHLVASKARVAPLSATSIPRLELMGAVLGLRLTMTISPVLDVEISQVVLWTDSMNVLWWIRGRSRKFKAFVANRVGEIQSVTNPEQWRYVPTEMNPGDHVTRGLTALELAQNDT